MGVINDIGVDVLRNRGIMVKVHRLKKDGEGNYIKPYIRERDEDSGEYIYDHDFIRFTNWTLANVEDDPPTGFGGFEAYQEALQKRPMRVVPLTAAHIFDMYELSPNNEMVPDLRFGATLLLDGNVHEYMIACLNALMLAQGVVSPELAAESVEQQAASLRKEKAEAEESMRKEFEKSKEEAEQPSSTTTDETTQTSHETTQTDPSPSTQSSPSMQDGVQSDALTTSSGT